MKIELRQYLETIGLTRSATEQDAWVFYGDLEGAQRAEAKRIRSGEQRSQNPPNSGESNDGESNGGNTEGTRAEAARMERERISSIREIFDGDFAEMQQRAESEEWTAERSAREYLQAVRERRQREQQPAGGNGTPAIHSRSAEDNVNINGLQAALLSRSGIQYDANIFNRSEARVMLGSDSWMVGDINGERRQRAMEAGDSFGSLSMVDLCRYSLQVAGQRVPHNQDEMIRAAFDTGSLDAIFTTSVHARVLVGYSEAGDTTVGWTSTEEDFANFQQHDMIGIGKSGGLTKHARKGKADVMDRGAETEPMRIARYSGQWCFDEMDVIDNRLGSGIDGTPEEMGRSAMQLRPDLVYSVLHANPSLVKDNKGPIFSAACNNDFGDTLSFAALEKAITAMSDQRQRGRPLNLQAAYLLVPPALKYDAKRILKTATVESDRANAQNSTLNAVQDELMVVADTRLGVAGVTDPDTQIAYAGKDDQFFVTASPNVGGAKTVSVAYRAGTGRSPQIRSYSLDRGEWGIGWDIKHDIGVKALDRIAMQRFNA